MNCPSCGHVMTSKLYNDDKVDVCSKCGGAWFDGDELTRMKDRTLPDAIWLDFDLWSDTDALKYAWSERYCPVCDRPMALISYGETGITIDVCVDHHGVFLEKGEFEDIITALENEIITKDVPEYLRETFHEAKEIITGSEGTHHEWKDFTTVVRLLSQRVMVENPTFARALSAFALGSPK